MSLGARKVVTISALEEGLRRFVSGARRVAVLGVGNDLRTDDGLGPFIIAGLRIAHPDLMIENVGSVPEAFARPLADFGAERVILIDAADMGKPAAHVDLITKERIGSVTISTHSMPLSLLMMYLEQETGGKTVLLGVQPKSIAFGEGLTPDIHEVGQKIISILRRVLKQYLRGLTDVPNNRVAR
jgi:hydrogenase 3 maturation protease